MKKFILISFLLIASTGSTFPGEDNGHLIGPFECVHNGVLYAVTMNNCPQYTTAHHMHYGQATLAGNTLLAYDENGMVIKKFDHTDLDCILKKIPNGD